MVKKDGMILELLIIRTKINTMNIVKTEIEGILILEPRLFRDSRGYFFESFSEREFEEEVAPILGHSVHFCLDKCDNFYHPEAGGSISILDDSLGIDWKIPTEHANLSEKDTKHAMLKDFDSPFDINVDLYK